MSGKSLVLYFLVCLCSSVISASYIPPEDVEDIDWDVLLGNGNDEDYLAYDPNEGNVILTVFQERDDSGDEQQPQNDIETSADGDVGQPEFEVPQRTPTPIPEAITIEKLAEKVDNLMSEVKAQQDKITELEESNKNLLMKIDSIEQQTKTNSLIFYNVPQSKKESYKTTLQKVIHIINRVLKVRAGSEDISVALRAESNSTKEGNKPIVVRFTNFATKMKVLSARHRLSHSTIEVHGDYSEQIAKRRAQLLPYMYRARSQGLYSFLLYDKLVINNVRKTLEELQAEDSESFIECSLNKKSNKEEEPDEQVEEVEVDPQFQDHDYD